MKHIQGFQGGMDKDTDNSVPRTNTYLNAVNMRLNTDEGQSEGALQNINGNSSFGTIPDTSIVYKVHGGNIDSSTSSTISITVNSTTYNSAPTLYAETFENIANLINTKFTSNIRAFLPPDKSYILVTSTNSTAITTLTISLSSTRYVEINTEIAAQTNLMPIGWTTIRDEIILLTTNVSSFSPTTGVGQIWKLTYDITTLSPTYTLLYNNIVNFTTFHPVAPTAITSRYENSTTKKIYWTDNYNQLRVFNTADTNGFITDPTLLNIQTLVDVSIPILKTITSGGNTQVGIYQTAYRLKNSKTVTTFSEASNLVSIVEKSEQAVVGGASSDTYIGSVQGTQANKTIHWEIRGLDTDYDRIEIVVLFYNTFNANPVITLTHDEEVPDDGIFIFSYSGNEKIDTLTTDEFLLQTFSFSHCKTITAKDNRLIASNTKQINADFTYDARAYRFSPGSTTLDLKNSQGNITSYSIPTGSASEWAQVAETHDAINPSNSTPSSFSHKYQRGSDRVMGGSGPNISYTFGTFCVKGDSTTDVSNIGISPFAHTNPRYDTGIINLSVPDGTLDQNYPTNGTNDGLKYAYRSGLLKGFQRNEVYRFAICFFDTQGRNLFARWIGDIKMPDYSDLNPNPDPIERAVGSPADFRLSFQGSSAVDGGANNAWLKILYVKFTVNIPTSIKQYVGGYRIVRVERTKDEKTIVAAGLLTQILSDGGTWFVPSHHTNNPYSSLDLNLNTGSTGTGAGVYPLSHFMFDSPDFLLTGYSGMKTGDAIVPALRLTKSNNTYDTTPLTETEPYRILKLYNNNTSEGGAFYYFDSSVFPLSEAGEVTYGQSKSFTTSGYNFQNYSTPADTSKSPSIGSKTLVVSSANGIYYGDATSVYACYANSFRKLYCLYYRPLTAQYGGASYSARSRNEYIACGSVQPVSTSDTTTSFTHNVFGGDVFLDIYDNQKLIKNTKSISGRDQSSVGVGQNSFTYFFPCESSHNFNLRHGTHMNKDLWANLGAGGIGGNSPGASYYETYDYNIVYSSENSVKTYITKPINFTALEENDTRTWFSEEKQDGEFKDSWTQFKPTSYYDADNYYGPINSILTFGDKIYFVQDFGFGIIPFNDRTLVSTGSQDLTTETNIGTPLDIIGRPEYISKTAGCKHQWGITTSDRGIYFFDVNSRQIFRYNPSQGFGVLQGISGYLRENLTGTVLTTDNPVFTTTTSPRAGVNCTTDFLNHDVLFTFFDFVQTSNGFLGQGTKRRFTIAFNEKALSGQGAFISFYSYTPALYINTRRHLITPYTRDLTNLTDTGELKKLYIHEVGNKCSFYGTIYDSSVKLFVNPFPNRSKIFTNLYWFTQSINSSNINLLTDTWKSLRVYNDFQNTDTISLTADVNLKRKERGWRCAIPRNRVKSTGGSTLDIFNSVNLDETRLFKEPIRDVYATVDLTYQNTNNNRFICPFIEVEYLPSLR